jgi:site-specific DNA-methyltransferase (adenine-specific)
MDLEKNIILGDCFELLKTIDSSSINLIAIDPPYEINYSNAEWDNKSLNWDFLFSEFKRILTPDGNLIIFQGWSKVSDTIKTGNNYFFLKNWIIYDRIKGRGAKTNLVSTREDILWFTNKNVDTYTYNKIPSTIKKKTGGLGLKNGNEYRAMSNVWTDISPIVPWSEEREKHPTQKPLQLMERIIKIWSNEGDIVLDCFAGTGTTLLAAKNLNRKFIGIESDINYFNTMKTRISQ